jgi:hypothetical protein
MTWTKLDDDFPDRDTILGLSDTAFRLHVCGLIACNRLLTDGFVSRERAARLLGEPKPDALAELVASGVWSEAEGGYRVVDSQGDQPTSDSVKHQREANAARVAKWRADQRKAREGSRKGSSRNGVRAPVRTERTTDVRTPTPDPSPFYEGRDTTAPFGMRAVVSDPRDDYDPEAYDRAVLDAIGRKAAS